jgi:hypothetical protein
MAPPAPSERYPRQRRPHRRSRLAVETPERLGTRHHRCRAAQPSKANTTSATGCKKTKTHQASGIWASTAWSAANATCAGSVIGVAWHAVRVGRCQCRSRGYGPSVSIQGVKTLVINMIGPGRHRAGWRLATERVRGWFLVGYVMHEPARLVILTCPWPDRVACCGSLVQDRRFGSRNRTEYGWRTKTAILVHPRQDRGHLGAPFRAKRPSCLAHSAVQQG